MARMLGVCQRSWCPYCRNKGFGLDCPDVAKSKGQARAAEKRAWRQEASASGLGILRDIQVDKTGPG